MWADINFNRSVVGRNNVPISVQEMGVIIWQHDPKMWYSAWLVVAAG